MAICVAMPLKTSKGTRATSAVCRWCCTCPNPLVHNSTTKCALVAFAPCMQVVLYLSRVAPKQTIGHLVHEASTPLHVYTCALFGRAPVWRLHMRCTPAASHKRTRKSTIIPRLIALQVLQQISQPDPHEDGGDSASPYAGRTPDATPRVSASVACPTRLSYIAYVCTCCAPLSPFFCVPDVKSSPQWNCQSRCAVSRPLQMLEYH